MFLIEALGPDRRWKGLQFGQDLAHLLFYSLLRPSAYAPLLSNGVLLACASVSLAGALVSRFFKKEMNCGFGSSFAGGSSKEFRPSFFSRGHQFLISGPNSAPVSRHSICNLKII